MKKFILTLMCLLCFSVICFAGEQEEVDSFKAMTNNIVSEIQESYNHGAKVEYSRITNQWYKYQATNLQSAIDIQKTDSLISPYKGILELQADNIYFYTIDNEKGDYANKEEASKASLSRLKKATTKTQFIYMYQDNNWVLKQVQSRFLDEYRWFKDEFKSPQEYFCMKEDN